MTKLVQIESSGGSRWKAARSTAPPTLAAEPTNDGFWRFWCPYCCAWHAHPKLRHQDAACRRPCRYFADGYTLVPRQPLRRQPG